MGAMPGRWVRRGCFTAAALCVLLAATMPAWAQDAGTGTAPEVWRGAARAGVASFDINRDALIPVDGVFRFVAFDGTSEYEDSLQTARASLFYPGEGMLQGPNLACGTFGDQFPEEFKPVLDACLSFDYPLTVKANASQADVKTDGAGAIGKPTDPISADAVGATAHAAADGTRTSAHASDLRVLGLPGVDITTVLPIEELKVDPTVVRVEDAISRTDQRIEAGALVATAESKLTGVTLVGGLVRIGSIVSTSKATDDGLGKRTAVADVEVSGVTVAGFPAQITEDGLVLQSPTNLGPIKQQLQQGVNQLLQLFGVRISVLDNVETTDDGTGLARAQAPGVLLEVTTEANGAPPAPGPFGPMDLNGQYVGTVQLGMSGAAAGAASFEDEFVPEPDVSFDAPVDAGFVPSDSGVVDTGDVVSDAPQASDQGSSSAPEQQYLRRIVDTFGGRMGLVYLAFGFAILGLCVAPGLTLPARLPGSRS